MIILPLSCCLLWFQIISGVDIITFTSDELNKIVLIKSIAAILTLSTTSITATSITLTSTLMLSPTTTKSHHLRGGSSPQATDDLPFYFRFNVRYDLATLNHGLYWGQPDLGYQYLIGRLDKAYNGTIYSATLKHYVGQKGTTALTSAIVFPPKVTPYRTDTDIANTEYTHPRRSIVFIYILGGSMFCVSFILAFCYRHRKRLHELGQHFLCLVQQAFESLFNGICLVAEYFIQLCLSRRGERVHTELLQQEEEEKSSTAEHGTAGTEKSVSMVQRFGEDM